MILQIGLTALACFISYQLGILTGAEYYKQIAISATDGLINRFKVVFGTEEVQKVVDGYVSELNKKPVLKDSLR